MKILVLGAGALGGYYGGRLAEAGADITFLVREARKRQLDRDGLQIESPIGNAKIAVNSVTADALTGPADVVLLSCKAYDLASAIAAIRPAVGPDSAVLPILNGIAHMETLNDVFGRPRVLGGLARIAATLKPDGTVQHLNEWRFITFGEQDGTMSGRVAALKAAFDRSSVQASAVPDIQQKMWDKIVHLCTIAAMSCLMRASVGEIVRSGGGDLLLEMLTTNAAIASAEGYPTSDASMAEYCKMFSDERSPYTASMLRDLERGGRVEADHVVGFMAAKAAAHGIEAKLLQAAYAHLKAYEERRAAGRL